MLSLSPRNWLEALAAAVMRMDFWAVPLINNLGSMEAVTRIIGGERLLRARRAFVQVARGWGALDHAAAASLVVHATPGPSIRHRWSRRLVRMVGRERSRRRPL